MHWTLSESSNYRNRCLNHSLRTASLSHGVNNGLVLKSQLTTFHTPTAGRAVILWLRPWYFGKTSDFECVSDNSLEHAEFSTKGYDELNFSSEEIEKKIWKPFWRNVSLKTSGMKLHKSEESASLSLNPHMSKQAVPIAQALYKSISIKYFVWTHDL